MPISRIHLRDILLVGLRKTPEERAAARAEADRITSIEAAKERSRYDALSDQERAKYDALTRDMMPSDAEMARRRKAGKLG